MKHKFELKDLDKSHKQLIITELDPALLKKAEKQVLDDLAKTIKVDGFREGKVPENVIRERVEDAYIKIYTLEKAIPLAANEIISAQKLRIVGEPKINFESMEPMKVIIDFDVFPEIELGDYKKITVKKDKKKASDKEVIAAIEHVQKNMTDYKDVDRAAKMDDRAEIDFDGFTADGVPLDNASSKNHPVILGSNMLIPGFEENVVGMKKDEEKEFEVTFPKDYHAKHLADKKVKFKVKLNKVAEANSPKIDEKFVEKVTGKKLSIDDWKKEVKEQLQKEHDMAHSKEVEEAYYDKLIAVVKAEIPQALIEEEKKAILDEVKQQILYRGLSYEKYLEATGKTEEQLLESYDKQADDRIKLRLALQEISQKEGVTVSDVEIEEKLNSMLNSVPEKDKEKLKQQYQVGSNAYQSLEYQIKMQKTLEKILPKV